jgi:hypothetical protein
LTETGDLSVDGKDEDGDAVGSSLTELEETWIFEII